MLFSWESFLGRALGYASAGDILKTEIWGSKKNLKAWTSAISERNLKQYWDESSAQLESWSLIKFSVKN